ncbi:MAG: YncE family protein [Haliscomenobacter sp.]|uniref:YncE family protein n=1 Tax=Haliscomenobacter sp. TaxID=2717303 RepID=UPI0029B51F14|nr:YncE family protein [Haliscomenobacter sp.]MDX2067802.1 YncE family protein [Haliscomenobacter sp.]
MKNAFLGLFTLMVLFANHNRPITPVPPYKITNRIHLEGDGFWDYLTVDQLTQRLYVSHGTQVQVIDLKTDKVIGAIPNTKGVHGVAISTDFGKGYISCGGDTSIAVFDLKSLTITGKIKATGANPDAILYDAFSKRVFVFNHSGKNATVIDAARNKVVGTILLDGTVEFAVTDGNGKVFVNIEDKSSIAVIDTKSLKVVKEWPVSPGEEPTGLAFDAKNYRLFSVCSNRKMVVLDSKTGKVVQTLPIGAGCDGVAFDVKMRRIYCSNGEGTMTVIEQKSPNEYQVVETVTTQQGARTITLDSKSHRLFLSTAEREAPVGNARPSLKPGTFVVLEISPL